MFKKLIAEILNFTSHNTGVTATTLFTFVVIVWIYGCESQVRSLADPARQVTRGELQTEIDTYLAMAEIRMQQLGRQDEFKSVIFKHALLWAQTGTINPLGVVAALAGVLGIGATVDNVTKRRREHKALQTYVSMTKEKK